MPAPRHKQLVPVEPPTLTDTQRDALTAIAGMLIYNSSSGRYEMYTGSSWQQIPTLGTSMDALSLQGKLLNASFISPSEGAIPTYNSGLWEASNLLYTPPTDYTPTLTQSGTVTKTVTRGRYTQLGKTVSAWGRLVPTATGSAGTAILAGLPVAAAYNSQVVGTASITLGGTAYRASVILNGTLTVLFREADVATASNMGVVPNVGLASSGDLIDFFAIYEAA